MAMRFVACLAVLAVGTAAAAQEKRTREQLIALAEKAGAAATAGNFEDAVAIWTDILDEVPESSKADIHANLAVAYKKLGRLPESWHHMTAYSVAMAGSDAAARKTLDDLEQKLKKTHVKVRIECEQADTRIYPGGDASGLSYSCPLSWWFPASGGAAVLAAKEGYKPLRQVVELGKAGSEQALKVALEVEASYGMLTVEGTGRLRIDGAEELPLPFTGKVKSGTHELTVKREGEPDWTRTVDVPANGSVAETVPPPSPPRPEVVPAPTGPIVSVPTPEEPPGQAWKWWLLGGGLAVAATGGLFQYLGYAKNEQLHDDYPDGTPGYPVPESNKTNYEQGYEDEVVPLDTTALVLYGIGGAAAVAGAVLLALPSDSGSDTAVQVGPMPGMDAGLQLQLSF